VVTNLKKIHFLEFFLDIIKVARLENQCGIFCFASVHGFFGIKITFHIVGDIPFAVYCVVCGFVGDNLVCQNVVFYLFHSEFVSYFLFYVEVAHIYISASFDLDVDVRA
jgi:hypothetical protein